MSTPATTEVRASSPTNPAAVREFLIFGLIQARACVFAASFFAILLLSKFVQIPGLARPDLILVAALVLQAVLLLSRIETLAEAAVLAVFHALGLALELFKTHPSIHSWAYPDLGMFHVATVPLYSGFMYAAVASYMCQSWRLHRLRLTGYPARAISIALSVGIYVNFFTHHWLPDFRWWLAGLVLLAFARTKVHFTVTQKERSMPLALSFLLIGFFVWVAENISTLLGAWVYPNQKSGWAVVSSGKITSWALLVILTFVIVAELKHYREGDDAVRR